MTTVNSIGATVVVVDDQTSVRITLARAMANQGYRTIPLASAQSCLEFCLKSTPDAILLDSLLGIFMVRIVKTNNVVLLDHLEAFEVDFSEVSNSEQTDLDHIFV